VKVILQQLGYYIPADDPVHANFELQYSTADGLVHVKFEPQDSPVDGPVEGYLKALLA
jgi:hypothetical protein